jgi:hypothetical protein
MNKDKVIELQNKALNKIEDYFEYRNRSKEDKYFVTNVLDNLTRELVKEAAR